MYKQSFIPCDAYTTHDHHDEVVVDDWARWVFGVRSDAVECAVADATPHNNHIGHGRGALQREVQEHSLLVLKVKNDVGHVKGPMSFRRTT